MSEKNVARVSSINFLHGQYARPRGQDAACNFRVAAVDVIWHCLFLPIKLMLIPAPLAEKNELSGQTFLSI